MTSASKLEELSIEELHQRRESLIEWLFSSGYFERAGEYAWRAVWADDPESEPGKPDLAKVHPQVDRWLFNIRAELARRGALTPRELKDFEADRACRALRERMDAVPSMCTEDIVRRLSELARPGLDSLTLGLALEVVNDAGGIEVLEDALEAAVAWEDQNADAHQEWLALQAELVKRATAKEMASSAVAMAGGEP